MNVGRFLGAVVAVALVRVFLNFLFYGIAMRSHFEALTTEYPGVFREELWGFIVADVLFALVFVYLWTKTGPCFGGGIKGGVLGGAWLGVLLGLVWSLYYFFTFTFTTAGSFAIDAVYTIFTLAIQGAIAAAIYKIPAVEPARA
jgi:hypothetical protein